ncbi:unnamed protein product [Hymenolepis diminuta]|uniref:Uncharacterized protein n=1 Tax=Hymenolepis diminuta TaxID=6216 RepID=A0A564YS51_HYMDI|nr:unnamed protein product [Hymenolepis diminuta]
MMSFTIQQIKPFWSELFVIAKSSALSGLCIVTLPPCSLAIMAAVHWCFKRCLRAYRRSFTLHARIGSHFVGTRSCFDNTIYSHTVL